MTYILFTIGFNYVVKIIGNNEKAIFQAIRRHTTRKRVGIAAMVVVLFLVFTGGITYAYFARDISDRDRLMNRSDTGIILRDRNGEVFYKYGQINGNDNVKLSEISDDFEKAIIASEDKDFYRHEGFSISGIAGAIYANLLNKDPTRYGGSTITQQLVKNKLLTADKNFLRKYQEFTLAVEVERKYTKDEILEMYVNSVYFGEGAFGIADASKAYFNKSPKDLTLAESTMLVGLLPAPAMYSPLSGDPTKAGQQQRRVLNHMAEAGIINEQTKQATIAQKLKYHPVSLDQQNYAQHYSLMVLDALKEKYGEERIIRAGFDVTTPLDLKWQKSAEAIVKERVGVFSAAGGRNATLVAIDPKTGYIKSLVGSADWNNQTFGKVNMALQSRQPGSSFKPIFYTEAMDRKIITPASVIKDQLTTYGGNYRPTNYDFKYRGNVTVRSALALSMNVPAVEVMQKLGPNEAAEAAQRMGLSTVTEPEKYGLSLALGTAEVKPLELTNAYAAFANQGEQHSPVLFTRVADKYGESVYEEEPTAKKRVVSPEAAYLTSSILSDQQARASTFGSALTIPGRQVAAKTGTTNDNRDAWTVGYTPSLAIGVWMGNNENQPMSGLAGASSAGTIWKQAMTQLVADTPNETFAMPGNVNKVRICVLQNNYEEVFIKGTEPKETCAKPATNSQKQQRKEEKEVEQEQKKKNEQEQEPSGGNGNGNGNSGPGGRGGGEETTPPSTEEPTPTEPAPDTPPTQPTNTNTTTTSPTNP